MIELASAFYLDYKRALIRRRCGNLLMLFLENAVQPIAVALAVAFAYLARSEVEPYRDTFLYFSGLYAFWIGLFGSCQSVNHELQNGEWRYWVLGLGRNRLVHLLAIFFVNCIFAFLQLMCFFVALVAVGWIDSSCGGGNILSHFTEMFVSTDSSMASPLFQMGGAMSPLLMAKYGVVVGPVVFSMVFFATSLVCAMISGCGFGFLFSVLIKEPSISLNVSVGFVVVLGMLSMCGLKGIRPVSKADNVDNAYLPKVEQIALEKRTPDKVYPESRVSYMVKLSEYLPQRYFFNMGRLTFNRNRVYGETGLIADALCGDAEVRPPWLRTGASHVYQEPPSLCNVEGLRRWIGSAADELSKFDKFDDQKGLAFLIEYIRSHPEVADEWGTGSWHRLLRRAICQEAVPLFVIFIVCMVISCSAVHVMEVYYDLR